MDAQAYAVERLAPKGWEVAVALPIVLVIGIGGVVLYFWMAPPPDGDLSQINMATLMAIQGAALTGAIAPLFIKHRMNAFHAIGLVSAAPRKIAIWSVVLLAISFALPEVVNPIMRLWSDASVPLLATAAMEVGLTQSGLIVMLLAMAVITPFGEEVFFRGVLFGWLRNRMRLRWAVPLQAILFGVVHLQVAHILLATGLGVGLALAREHSRSLWPAIGAHALINAVAVILAYVRLEGSASG